MNNLEHSRSCHRPKDLDKERNFDGHFVTFFSESVFVTPNHTHICQPIRYKYKFYKLIVSSLSAYQTTNILNLVDSVLQVAIHAFITKDRNT